MTTTIAMTTTSATCLSCGEDWPGSPLDDQGRCLNCRPDLRASHPHLAWCPTCGRADVPAQFHHIASERQHPMLGLRLCLVCHKILTDRQVSAWHPSWRVASHPVRCIVQGMLDLLWLWWQRSGWRWWERQVSELARVVWHALVELFGLVGLSGWEGVW